MTGPLLAARQAGRRFGRRVGLMPTDLEIDEAEVKKHPFEPELPQRSFYADGSVGDW